MDVATAEAVAFLRERGGRLFAWKLPGRCSGQPNLAAPPRANPRRESRLAAAEPLDAHLRVGLTPPGELQVQVRRFRRRVAAYPNGCSLVW